ncbi:uncharacterized protein BN807_01623 [Ruminococcus sp. CAG:90]|nr:uncharacterized protein BN807_01623 [Ruminococcus sp. CAG:90]
MKRPVFSFRPNLEKEDHRQAWEILQSVPERKRSQHLVSVILKAEKEDQLEKLIRNAIREELSGCDLTQKKETEELPDQMLDFLSKIDDIF